MKNVLIKCKWVEDDFYLKTDKIIQISIVAYEHSLGMPARFYIGMVPAIDLSKQLESIGIKSTIRLIDPTSIANYCNGWTTKESKLKKVISDFLNNYNVDFFFDEAEQVSDDSLKLLSEIGNELISSTDIMIIDMVERIKESGKKHGGEQGSDNAMLYMAAHPFSWLDMYHPLIWKRQYSSDNYQFVNLMSKPESRFTFIRKFLQKIRPDLSTFIDSLDLYTTVCNTPCYIPLEDEPTFLDLTNNGYNWCYSQYQELKKRGGNYRRAFKDFESLMNFNKCIF